MAPISVETFLLTTTCSVRFIGNRAVYPVRGWVRSITVPGYRFKLLDENDKEIGDGSDARGVWKAPYNRRPTAAMNACIPVEKDLRYTLNLGAYRKIIIETAQAPEGTGRIQVKQEWFVPLRTDNHNLLYTHHFRPDAFLAQHPQLKAHYPTVQVDLPWPEQHAAPKKQEHPQPASK